MTKRRFKFTWSLACSDREQDFVAADGERQIGRVYRLAGIDERWKWNMTAAIGNRLGSTVFIADTRDEACDAVETPIRSDEGGYSRSGMSLALPALRRLGEALPCPALGNKLDAGAVGDDGHSLPCRRDLDCHRARAADIEQPHDAAQRDLIANIESSLCRHGSLPRNSCVGRYREVWQLRGWRSPQTIFPTSAK